MPETVDGKVWLTASEKRTLEDLQEEIDNMEEEISRAKTAGIDLGALPEEFKAAKKQRDGLLRHYTR